MTGQETDEARERLILEIERDFTDTADMTGCNVLSPAVRAALATVPREQFVPEWLRRFAYDNRPLTIGHGQTISQPYIVALMTELLELQPGDRVLEIGTGSGYQAAVLAQLVPLLYSVETVPELAEQARVRLQQVHCTNVEIRTGNGWYGWPEHAPYDAIIVTAASRRIPPPLVEQLRNGGRLLLPVHFSDFEEELVIAHKDERGRLRERKVLPVAFVPLLGEPPP